MIEVQLSKQGFKTIVALYANVVEYFIVPGQGGGESTHVGHIKSIEITTDGKGRHNLVIVDESRTFLDGRVDDDQLTKVREWIAEVQRSMQSTAL